VEAPADLVYQTAAEFDMDSLPLVHAIFALRSRFMGAGSAPPRPFRTGLVTGARQLGWGTLVEEPGRLFVAGAYCQPWLGNVTFHPLTADTFASFTAPDQVKIAWTLETTSVGPRRCILATETRVLATSPEAQRRFRRYWRWARFGIYAIRWLLLPAIRRAAERQASAAGSTTG
jgi:hypothetical protein